MERRRKDMLVDLKQVQRLKATLQKYIYQNQLSRNKDKYSKATSSPQWSNSSRKSSIQLQKSHESFKRKTQQQPLTPSKTKKNVQKPKIPDTRQFRKSKLMPKGFDTNESGKIIRTQILEESQQKNQNPFSEIFNKKNNNLESILSTLNNKKVKPYNNSYSILNQGQQMKINIYDQSNIAQNQADNQKDEELQQQLFQYQKIQAFGTGNVEAQEEPQSNFKKQDIKRIAQQLIQKQRDNQMKQQRENQQRQKKQKQQKQMKQIQKQKQIKKEQTPKIKNFSQLKKMFGGQISQNRTNDQKQQEKNKTAKTNDKEIIKKTQVVSPKIEENINKSPLIQNMQTNKKQQDDKKIKQMNSPQIIQKKPIQSVSPKKNQGINLKKNEGISPKKNQGMSSKKMQLHIQANNIYKRRMRDKSNDEKNFATSNTQHTTNKEFQKYRSRNSNIQFTQKQQQLLRSKYNALSTKLDRLKQRIKQQCKQKQALFQKRSNNNEQNKEMYQKAMATRLYHKYSPLKKFNRIIQERQRLQRRNLYTTQIKFEDMLRGNDKQLENKSVSRSKSRSNNKSNNDLKTKSQILLKNFRTQLNKQ